MPSENGGDKGGGEQDHDQAKQYFVFHENSSIRPRDVLTQSFRRGVWGWSG
jgi:hypothetical protein